jgi:hypothetical protein
MTTDAPAGRWHGAMKRILSRIARHPETVAFGALALLYVLPLWSFRYLPTQDGPSHLDNAQILKDYGDPGAGYQPFYEIRPDPLPNLTSHLLLVGLLYVAPPLWAEKILVSLYVLGFAAAFRYFLGAFGDRCRPLSWAGLLLVYDRCFWMGFYNYCLALVLLWLILGFCLRQRQGSQLHHALVLMALFTVAYFTHLMVFLLAVIGAAAAALAAHRRRVLSLGLVLLAALPAACLAMDYFEQTGFFRDSLIRRLLRDPFAGLHTGGSGSVEKRLTALDDELFAHHIGTLLPGTLVLTAYLVALAVLTAGGRLFKPQDAAPEQRMDWADVPRLLYPGVFGALLLGAYLVLPEHLGMAHGGFIGTRLAPLPFLLALACMREPVHFPLRVLVRGLTVGLLVMNLLLVTDTLDAGNEELDEYTAGIEAVGRGHRLFVIQQKPHPIRLVDPLLHAAHYYCLGTGNVDLDNYEATTMHFPVKYRPGIPRGRDNWTGYPRQDAVDVVLCWRPSANGPPRALAGWDEIFSRGPLRIYRRTQAP